MDDGAKKSPDSWPIFDCLFTVQANNSARTNKGYSKPKVIQQERETGAGISPVFQTVAQIRYSTPAHGAHMAIVYAALM